MKCLNKNEKKREEQSKNEERDELKKQGMRKLEKHLENEGRETRAG